MKVLVAEDNPSLRELVTEILTVWGHEVHAVGDGREAVCHLLVQATEPDLVITDYQMPNMDGISLTCFINSRIKVIVMSGDDPDKIREAAREAGAEAFIAKPFKLEELKTTIARLFP